MSLVLKYLFTCLIIFSYINSLSLSPTQNNCSYLDANEQPTDENICLYTSMANYESCCYVEYSDKKFCVTLTENIADPSNYNNETIKNSFDDKGSITKIVCPGIYVTHKYINNCGLVGILPPISKENCSGISIPESNCCMLELTDGNKLCRRVKKLPKDENDIKDEVKQDISNLIDGASVNKIYCSEHFVHLATSILVICLLTVIL
jgi:hypothetical protein